MYTTVRLLHPEEGGWDGGEARGRRCHARAMVNLGKRCLVVEEGWGDFLYFLYHKTIHVANCTGTHNYNNN